MSFKGIITRGEYDRGIDLSAKVVSPNKKYSSKQTIPVTIKANALTDREKCLLALNEHKAAILSLGDDLNDISYDITDKLIESDSFGYKTNTVYAISSPLSNYITNAGMITAYPKYGGSDVSGTIAITTSLNGISMTTHVPLTIKALSASDVLNDSRLSEANLWTLISNSQPINAVQRALDLISTYTMSDVSDTAVSITWSVTDTALPIFNGFTDISLGYNNLNYNRRINSETGAITMIPYTVAQGVTDTLTSASIPYVHNVTGTSSQIRSYCVGGITLRATLSLTGTEITRNVTFDDSTTISGETGLKVRTEYLTTSEIINALNVKGNKVFQFTVVGNNSFNNTYPVNSSTTPYNISINSTTDTQLTFKVQANGENIPVAYYGLETVISLFHDSGSREIYVGNINTTSSTGTSYTTTYPTIFSTWDGPTAAGDYSITLNTANLKTLVDSGDTSVSKFTIAINYSCVGYPADGTSTASNPIATVNGKAYICFDIGFTNT